MADSRNGCGNLRGGGNRTSGGSGRNTTKFKTGNSRGPGALGGAGKMDRKLLAKRNLQLLAMSKQLALEARQACLMDHTMEEWEELEVPMPDPESAMKKLKAMSDFTEDWHDAEFRARWLKSVLEVWKRELMEEFKKAFETKIAINATARARWEAKRKNGGVEPQRKAQSTAELEAMLQDASISGEERKKIKKKLKKRKQREKKKEAGSA